MILEALSYSREAVAAGEWWRLATASLAHLSWPHALGNGLVLALLTFGLRRLLRPLAQLAVLATGAVATGLGIHLLSGLAWYAGLSGALWALAGCGTFRFAHRAPLPGRAMLALLALAVLLDQHRDLSWSGEPLAPLAHLYGFIAGIACAWSWTALARPSTTDARASQSWQSGTISRIPSSSSRIRIWQLRRLAGRRSAAVYSSISSSTDSGPGIRSSQSAST